MKKFSFIVLLGGGLLSAQTVKDCNYRFKTYLNFHNSLNSQVQFENDKITVKQAGTQAKQVFYADELPALASFFNGTSVQVQQQLLANKGSKHFSKQQLDSLRRLGEQGTFTVDKSAALPLKGMRIALDAGHSAVTLKEAAWEQKYLYYARTAGSSDSVKIFESALSFATASLIKKQLEEKGAEVMMTRYQQDHTSFGCTLSEWMKHRKKHLDSLLKCGGISAAKYKALYNANEYKVFWEFFRDYDLGHRADLINAFKPHVTLIVHYNVDEKNVPWKQTTDKNFTMAFIAGAMTADQMDNASARLQFMRLLLSPHLNKSEELSAKTVQQFANNLKVPIASKTDADYLLKNCNSTSTKGVYCRNLALCRKINSPLLYGECLYQDNEKESKLLMENGTSVGSGVANARVEAVAKSYVEGLMGWLGM